MNLPDLEKYLEEIAQKLRDEEPKPQFHYVVEWADNYEALLSGEFTKRGDAASIRGEAQSSGRVIIHGEGGSGKSTVLRRIFTDAQAQRSIPVLVDLRSWRKSMFERWDEARGNPDVALDTLLSDLGQPAVTDSDIAALAQGRKSLLLVDGLNEIPPVMADIALRALESFAQRHPSGAVIVADRLVRRDLPSGRWRIGRLRLDEEKLALRTEQHPDLSRIPSTPFFLNLLANENLEASSISAAFASFLYRHAGIGGEELERIGHAAFIAYIEGRYRMFRLERFREMAGDEAVRRLEESSLLIMEGNQGYFQHHLLHDYLASVWMAPHPDEWVIDVFNPVTAWTSSFDVLALTLEQIADQASADLFIRRVYDWNFYGSAYALAEAEAAHASKVSPWMKTALLAMLADRRWDVIKYTSQRVADSLRLFRSREADFFLRVESHRKLMELVASVRYSEAEFRNWQQLFTANPGEQVPDDLVATIAEENSLIGWTVANVLKRVIVSGTGHEILREMLRTTDSRPTIRWRAAHALGGDPSPETVEVLFAALKDSNGWVRYGAVRSIIECSYRSEVLRTKILGRLSEQTETLRQDGYVMTELYRALVLRDAPPDWSEAVTPLVERLWLTADSLEEQDRVRRLASEIQMSPVASA